MRRIMAGGFALALSAAATAAQVTPPGRPEPVTVTGTALLLTEALKSAGLTVDQEPMANLVVIKGDDGSIHPLLSDDASRALFKDNRLRGRRTEVKGLRREGLPFLQVVSFRIEQDGRFRTPEYYCEICTISVRDPQICPCCQGDMVLRMKPEPR